MKNFKLGNVIFALSFFVTAAGALIFFKTASTLRGHSSSSGEAQQNEVGSAVDAAAAARSVQRNQPETLTEVASPNEKTAEGARFEWLPSAHSAVAEFARLAEKVFPSPDEQMRKSEILMNPDFIKNIADYLLSKSDMDIRDEAIDLLIEALKLGNSEADIQIERIVADKQIESKSLPLEFRKSLSETKGEILYQYVALNSEKESQVASWLPGPVSEKIWSNVKTLLEANFAESKRELAEIQ